MLTLCGTNALFDALRFFALSDAAEQGCHEVPLLYPTSPIYLVSGLSEDSNGIGVCD